jgi:hypothetical protein
MVKRPTLSLSIRKSPEAEAQGTPRANAGGAKGKGGISASLGYF